MQSWKVLGKMPGPSLLHHSYGFMADCPTIYKHSRKQYMQLPDLVANLPKPVVCTDGGLWMCTPVDPLFILLPIVATNCRQVGQSPVAPT